MLPEDSLFPCFRPTALKLPSGKGDAIFFDQDMPGFGLRLRASGDRVRRSWVAQYRAKGRTRRVLIGSAETLSADQARAAAKKVLAQVTLGSDPQGDKVAARLKLARTLRSVAEDFLNAKKPSLRKNSFRNTELYLTGPYFKPLHTTTISEITRADVAARLTAITRNSGSITAARARSALSSLFSWAVGEGLAELNPVVGTNKPDDAPARERVLTETEIATIWRACGDDHYGRIVRLLLLTACRRHEVGGMAWDELDLDRGTWVIPASRAKNKRAHSLLLPPLALSIIAAVPRIVDRNRLFGERAESGFTEWSLGKRELDARLAGEVVERWRVHDLRRSVATGMANIGIQPHIIEAVLNHYSGHRAGAAGVYNRSPYEREVKAALARWASHLEEITTGIARKIVAFDRLA
jgi:integrase